MFNKTMRTVRRGIADSPTGTLLAVGVIGLAHGCLVSRRSDRHVVRKGAREIHLARNQWPYLLDAVQRFDRCHASVAPRYVGKVAVADFSRPQLHHLPWLGVELFCTSIAEEEADVEAYLNRFAPAPGDVILDIGAYCGATTCAFSRALGPSGRVVAVEADPHNVSALNRNVEHLGLTNVTTVHAAIWSSSTTLRFAAEGALGSAIVESGARQGNAVDVRAMTLDDLCSELGLKRVDHLKLDVEGAEYEILRGNRDFFARHRPKVMMEVHASSEAILDFAFCEEFFESLGYRSQRDIDNLLYCEPIKSS